MFIGIHVSKRLLDVACRPSGEQWSVDDDETGLQERVPRLQAMRPQLMGLEATGGRERAAGRPACR